MLSIETQPVPIIVAEQYPSVALADIYAVISFYLKNKKQVDDYLTEQKVSAGKVRQIVEDRTKQIGIRQRLLARKG